MVFRRGGGSRPSSKRTAIAGRFRDCVENRTAVGAGAGMGVASVEERTESDLSWEVLPRRTSGIVTAVGMETVRC